jgi:hypothetical protein
MLARSATRRSRTTAAAIDSGLNLWRLKRPFFLVLFLWTSKEKVHLKNKKIKFIKRYKFLFLQYDLIRF